jgi:hypothetical protein
MARGNPKIGRPKNPRDKWRDRIKNMGRPSITDVLSGGREGKPHSSKEGRRAAAGRTFRRIAARGRPIPKLPKPKRIPGRQPPTDPRSPYVKDRVMTPLRAKHGLGNIVKKIITKIKPKPKPKPKPGGLKDRWKTLDTKVEGETILGPEKGKYGAIDKVMTNLEKQTKKGIKNPHYNPDFKAKGGRIGKGHGGSAAQQHYLQHGYGPTKAKLRAGKPKIAKKGWA